MAEKYFNIGWYGRPDDFGWVAFCDVFEQLGVVKNKDFTNFRKLVWSLPFYTVQLDKYCIVSRMPTSLYRTDYNDNKVLHSDIAPAIAFKDGYEQHYLWGVYLDKQLWTEITAKMITAKKVLSLENLEQRMVAMKYLGSDWLLDNLEGKKVDEGETDVVGSLWQVSIPGVHKEAKLMKFRDPSTDRVYVLGVPPETKTVVEGQAWLGQMSEKEYSTITIQT